MKEYKLECGKIIYARSLSPIEIIKLTTKLTPLLSTAGCLVDVYKNTDKTSMFTSLGYNLQQALQGDSDLLEDLYKDLSKTLCNESGDNSEAILEAMEFLIGDEVLCVAHWLIMEHLSVPLLKLIKKTFKITDDQLDLLRNGFNIENQNGEEV